MKHYLLAVSIGLSMMAAAGHAAQAQTLSLTPTTSAQVGDTITFTLNLNPASNGSNLFEYDLNLALNSAYLQFATTAPGVYYTPSAANTLNFPFAESTANTLQMSGANSVLRLTYDNASSTTSFVGATVLGTFSVTVVSALPTGGTPLTFGPVYSGVSSTATNGGSELLANFGDEVLQSASGATLSPPPASAPEPSGGVAFLLGATGIGLRLIRSRRRAN